MEGIEKKRGEVLTIEEAAQRMMVGENCGRLLAVRRSFRGSRMTTKVEEGNLYMEVFVDKPRSFTVSLKACIGTMVGVEKTVDETGRHFIIRNLRDGEGKISSVYININKG